MFFLLFSLLLPCTYAGTNFTLVSVMAAGATTPAGTYAAFRIPALLYATNSQNSAVLAFAEGRMFGCGDLHGRHDLVFRRSLDGGVSWEPLTTIVAAPAVWPDQNDSAIWDPTPVQDKSTGEIFVFFGRSIGSKGHRVDMWYVTSKDLGATWSSPVNVSSSCFSNGNTPANGHGIYTTSGRLIIPLYDCPGQTVCFSDDHGVTWHKPALAYGTAQAAEGEVVELFEKTPGGSPRLLYNFRWDGSSDCGNGVPSCRVFMYSDDLGSTWYNKTFVPTLVDPQCKGSVARWEGGGIVFANAATSSSRKYQTIRLSTDDGVSFPYVQMVDVDSGYSTLQVTEEGNILNLYEANGGCSLKLAIMSVQSLLNQQSDPVRVSAPIQIGVSSRLHFWFPQSLTAFNGKPYLQITTSGDAKLGQHSGWALFANGSIFRSWQNLGPTQNKFVLSVPQNDTTIMGIPFQLFPVASCLTCAQANATLYQNINGSVVVLPSASLPPIKFTGFPQPFPPDSKGLINLNSDGNLLVLEAESVLFTTLYAENHANLTSSIYAMVSADQGRTWTYRATVASNVHGTSPVPQPGPTESATIRLTSSSDLHDHIFCVFRVVSGQSFWKTVSLDGGRTWSSATQMQEAHSVAPRLHAFPSGLTILTGGRDGLFLWYTNNASNPSASWKQLDLAAHHNATVPDPAWEYKPAESWSEQSTSYTGLVPLSEHEVLVCYDRLSNGWSGPSPSGPNGKYDAVFCVTVTDTTT
eukprot:m.164631 g.164631  ORF g.164631 m.164631 type:complete len:747 (-) comp24951_c0_seq2:58-2298(-)